MLITKFKVWSHTNILIRSSIYRIQINFNTKSGIESQKWLVSKFLFKTNYKIILFADKIIHNLFIS